jgi:hypothetical protein
MGAARKSQELKKRGGMALAPWKAKCIQSAGNKHKSSFLKLIKKPNNYTEVLSISAYDYSDLYLVGIFLAQPLF